MRLVKMHTLGAALKTEFSGPTVLCMRMMDLDDLHIFRCVVREGGVSRAASRLHRVPSNVTTRIRQRSKH